MVMISSYKKIISFFVMLLILNTNSFVPLNSLEDSKTVQTLDLVRDIILENYVRDVSDEILQERSIEEMMKNLDTYSQYMNVEEFGEFSQSIDLDFEGIGVKIEQVEEGLLITEVFSDGGADESGLKQGDIIQQVDGEEIKDKPVEYYISKIRGEQGSYVQLFIYRPKENKNLEFTVIRKKVNVPVVTYKKLGGNIGYLRLLTFNHHSVADLGNAIEALGDVNSYIFDLRNNLGGYFGSAQGILGFFPKVEKAVIVADRKEEQRVYLPIKQKEYFSKEVRTLVNPYSASASEIVAAALLDYEASTLYGQTTYGKGTVQTLFNIYTEDQKSYDVLKLTTSEFISPLGNAIDTIGITPNIVTDEGEELKLAHKDALESSYPEYFRFPDLQRDVDTSSFKIRFSNEVRLDFLEDKIELIRLGGEKVELSFQNQLEGELEIRLLKPLQKESEYILYIHPGVVSLRGQVLNKGYKVTVNIS
jgi:carboxyl-terminal processing protease